MAEPSAYFKIHFALKFVTVFLADFFNNLQEVCCIVCQFAPEPSMRMQRNAFTENTHS